MFSQGHSDFIEEHKYKSPGHTSFFEDTVKFTKPLIKTHLELLKKKAIMSNVIYLANELIDLAQNCGLKSSRSASEQIEYWVRIGEAAGENPDIPPDLLIDILQSKEDIKRGIHSEYKFGQKPFNS